MGQLNAAAIAFSLQNASMTISMQFLDVGMVSVLLYLAIPMGYILCLMLMVFYRGIYFSHNSLSLSRTASMVFTRES